MAYSVSNGALGKNPLIDKMNQLPAVQVKRLTSEQMEELVFGHENVIYPSVPISFHACKEEVRKQLQEYQSPAKKCQ